MTLLRLFFGTRMASTDDKRSATVTLLDHVRMKPLRPAVAAGRTNEPHVRSQFKFKRVEAERQSLPNGFKRRFLEAPELKECAPPHRTACAFERLRLGFRKIPSSEF